MNRVDGRPSWQAGPCPPWCVVVHGEDDHERDRKHMGAAHHVPVVELAGSSTRSGTTVDRGEGVDLMLCLQRRDGAPDTWLYAGDGTDQMLEMGIEGWARVVPVLDRLIADARG